MGGKEFLNLVTILTLHIDPKNLKIPIIGVSQKVTIDDEVGRGCLETVWKLRNIVQRMQIRMDIADPYLPAEEFSSNVAFPGSSLLLSFTLADFFN